MSYDFVAPDVVRNKASEDLRERLGIGVSARRIWADSGDPQRFPPGPRATLQGRASLSCSHHHGDDVRRDGGPIVASARQLMQRHGGSTVGPGQHGPALTGRGLRWRVTTAVVFCPGGQRRLHRELVRGARPDVRSLVGQQGSSSACIAITATARNGWQGSTNQRTATSTTPAIRRRVGRPHHWPWHRPWSGPRGRPGLDRRRPCR